MLRLVEIARLGIAIEEAKAVNESGVAYWTVQNEGVGSIYSFGV